MEDAVIIERETAVHGAFPDTQAWQTRYTQTRQDLLVALQQVPGFVETFRQLAPHELYRIVWSPEMVTAIKEGSAVWKRGKEGFLSVVLRKSGGEIVKHLSLERMRPVQFAPVAQLATQSMLSQVIERLEVIDQKVSAILQGQLVDRLGKLLGAEDQFREALKASGEDRRILLRQCVGSFNDARGPAILYIQSALGKLDYRDPGWQWIVQYLLRHKSPGHFIREEMGAVHLHLLAAVRATRYLEEVYEELGQPASAEQALASFTDHLGDLLPRGRQAALWLRFDPANPPEALWDLTRQMIEGPSRHARNLLATVSLSVEMEIRTSEIVGSEAEHE